MNMDDTTSTEDKDGLRFSWGVWPSTKIEVSKIVVPPAFLEDMPAPLPYQPIRCKGASCGCVLNPFCGIDFRSKLWTCPFCQQRNHFPPNYAEVITETNLPAELFPKYTTVEYEPPVQQNIIHPPIFLFVIDTTVDEESLNSLKDTIQQALEEIPDNAIIGIITFGTHVYVHEICTSGIPKSYAFRGSKIYEHQKVVEMLGLNRRVQASNISGAPGTVNAAGATGGNQQQLAPALKFLQPKGQCEYEFSSILDDITKDPWPVTSENRASRCTGAALSIAVSLLESCFPRSGARIMTFVGGACTIGPGMVLGTKLSEEMRSHTDIKKGNDKHLQPATEFYDKLAQRCIKNLHTIDLFACCLDQVGLLEMHSCIEKTGGLVVLADSMKVSMFKESFRRVFSKFGEDASPEEQKYLSMAFGASCDILTSKEYQVEGCIGPCYSLNVKNPCVSDTVLGEGGTSSWYLGALDTQTTLAFYFDVNNTSPISESQPRFLQIITRYQHSNGKNRIRVTTSMGAWSSDPSNNISVSCSFDQECATAIMARIAAHRTQEEDSGDVLRWLDRSLIRLIAKFADYRPNDPNSLKLSNEFNFYPQFMFHLRRSQFLESLNCSPDETTYNRMMLERQNTRNSLVMIQPALLSYSFQGSPIPVLLDVTSVRADAILLLDTFFHVVIFYGSTMAQWRDAGYQNLPEHANFKKLLEQPQEHAQEIMSNRFPVPRFILCDQYKSQSRFLMAKLNPSITHRNVDGTYAPVFTDDVSLSVFMEHLKKIAVTQ